MFAKTQAKIILRYYEQTLSNFSITLYPSQASIDHSISHLHSSVSLWSNIRKHLLFSGSSCAETLLWQKQLIPASFYLKSIPLLLISVTLHYLSTIPSSAVGEETSEPETSCCVRWKLYCYSSPSHLTPENFVSSSAFCLSFVFFVFAFWPIKTTTADHRVWLTQTHQKVLNQVTLSNEHMNHLFWA